MKREAPSMPANVDAERSILGTILLDNAAFDTSEELTRDDFSLDSHRRIYSAMVRMRGDNRAIDIITLSEELRNTHELEAIGGVAYLASLTEGLPRRLSIDEYVRIVKDKAQRRRLINVCRLTIDKANEHDTDAEKLIADHGSRLRDVTSGEVQGWPIPEPLITKLPPVPAFDLQLLPDALQAFAGDVTERMQTPLDFAAVVIVLALAGVTNRRALIQPKARDTSWVAVPNLWGGIIASPGLLKSPLIRSITRPLTKIDALWRNDYESKVANYSQEKEELELRMSAWKQLSTAALKKNEEIPTRPDDSVNEPQLKRLITQDATAEKLHEILRDNPAGVLIIRDELSGWFESLERQGREGERAFFLSAWNGDTGHTIDRIGRGSIYVPACCVSILGAIPPSRLRAYLEDVLNDGPANDGLLQRFQVFVWPDVTGSFEYLDRPEDEYASFLVSNIFESIARMDSENPARFRFTAEAQALFEEWLKQLERRLRSDELPTVMQAHLAKYRSLMPSLALLFALADGESQLVDLRHAQRAAGWCSYLEAHAVRTHFM